MPMRKKASHVAVSGGNRNSSNFCHCHRRRLIEVCGSSQCFSPLCRDAPAPLPSIFITQTEIVAEQRLEGFAPSMLKIADARRSDRSKSSPNFFHIRALAPDRQSEHFYHYLPQGFVTIVTQPC